MKEKKTTKTMPMKNVKNIKQHQFPVLKKVTRKEKLTNIKFRYSYITLVTLYGRVSQIVLHIFTC